MKVKILVSVADQLPSHTAEVLCIINIVSNVTYKHHISLLHYMYPKIDQMTTSCEISQNNTIHITLVRFIPMSKNSD